MGISRLPALGTVSRLGTARRGRFVVVAFTVEARSDEPVSSWEWVRSAATEFRLERDSAPTLLFWNCGARTRAID
jgi:hypothetical protein